MTRETVVHFTRKWKSKGTHPFINQSGLLLAPRRGANESAEASLARSRLHLLQLPLLQNHLHDIPVPRTTVAVLRRGISSLSWRSGHQFCRHPLCTLTPNLPSLKSTYTCVHQASHVHSPFTGTRHIRTGPNEYERTPQGSIPLR